MLYLLQRHRDVLRLHGGGWKVPLLPGQFVSFVLQSDVPWAFSMCLRGRRVSHKSVSILYDKSSLCFWNPCFATSSVWVLQAPSSFGWMLKLIKDSLRSWWYTSRMRYIGIDLCMSFPLEWGHQIWDFFFFFLNVVRRHKHSGLRPVNSFHF